MAKPFDYSKWDNIELSDDESDLHPNIDKESWFRLKHRTRLEREEREDQEVREYQGKNDNDNARIGVIQARLKGVSEAGEDEDAAYEDTSALEVELQELQAQVAARNRRIAEIDEKRKWNIDNICRVKDEKTIVNEIRSKPLKDDVATLSLDQSPTAAAIARSSAPSSSAPSAATTATAAPVPAASTTATAAAAAAAAAVVPSSAQPIGAPEPAAALARERMAVISYNDYVIKHEALLEKYCEIADLEATKDYIFKHCDVLLHEHAQSYILLSCLEDEMNGKHQRMKLVCRQSQILSHIHELGASMKRDPRDVILPFFKRIEDKQYLTGFLQAVEEFTQKVQKRAVEKRKEMDAERSAAAEDEDELVYEGEDEDVVGPGGLNPFKVLKALPTPLRRAFESQDIPALHKVIAEMKPEDAKYWMKQCVDSGLWVAKDASIFEDDGEEEEEGEGDEEPQAESEEVN